MSKRLALALTGPDRGIHEAFPSSWALPVTRQVVQLCRRGPCRDASLAVFDDHLRLVISNAGDQSAPLRLRIRSDR